MEQIKIIYFIDKKKTVTINFNNLLSKSNFERFTGLHEYRIKGVQ